LQRFSNVRKTLLKDAQSYKVLFFALYIAESPNNGDNFNNYPWANTCNNTSRTAGSLRWEDWVFVTIRNL